MKATNYNAIVLRDGTTIRTSVATSFANGKLYITCDVNEDGDYIMDNEKLHHPMFEQVAYITPITLTKP